MIDTTVEVLSLSCPASARAKWSSIRGSNSTATTHTHFASSSSLSTSSLSICLQLSTYLLKSKPTPSTQLINMQFGKLIALAYLGASAGGVADAFKIRAFSGSGCTGSAKEVNVWDNTCRNTDVPETRSFRVLSYGAHRQRATFFGTWGCDVGSIGGPPTKDWWADGGSNEFKKDACLDLSFNARAYNSRSA